jgi:hypothetical protein
MISLRGRATAIWDPSIPWFRLVWRTERRQAQAWTPRSTQEAATDILFSASSAEQMPDASGKYDRERRNEEPTPSSPLARLWSHFKNAFSRNDDQRRTEARPEGGEPLSMAWVWGQFKAAFPQSDEERRALDEGPAPMAWVWSQFKAVLPQHDEERHALSEAPAPMAWLWSHFKAELPQSDEERRALDEAPAPMAWLWKIGRASCRERVSPSV